MRGLSKSWDSDSLQLTIKGLKAKSASSAMQKLARLLLLSTSLVRRLVAFADAAWPDSWFPVMLLVAWALLLRVQSEALPLEVGSLPDLTTLPPSRHSAVCWDETGTLWVRWQRRKHRPQGCTRSLPCACSTDGFQFCAVCRLRDYVAARNLQPGDRCWRDVSVSSSLSILRQGLTMLQIPGAAAFTWKAVRAGRATELSRTPHVTIQEVMDAGDWRSQAVFNYIKPDEIEPLEALAIALEESDPESQ